jgi:hypothetical protein
MTVLALPVDFDTLDPGIRGTVRWLQENGFHTTDSGDGASKSDLIATGDALDFPHVFMTCAPEVLVSEARRLYAMLGSFGTVEATYSPNDGIAVLALIGVTDDKLPKANRCSKCGKKNVAETSQDERCGDDLCWCVDDEPVPPIGEPK